MNAAEKITFESRYAPQVIVAAYNVLFTNDICMGQFIEAREGMKRTPWYKTEVKQALNLAEASRRKYEAAINYQMRGISEFFADANESFTQDIRRHVEILYYSIKKAMDAQGVPCSRELARMELTRALSELSCEQYDMRTKELKRNGIVFNCSIAGYMRPTAFARLVHKAMFHLQVLHGKDLATDDCRLAGEILSKKLADVETIARAINEEQNLTTH